MLEIILLLFICSVENVKIGADNSIMTITNAQAKNQGTYRCVASNLFGMTHSIASFIVRGKPVQKQSLIIFHLVHTIFGFRFSGHICSEIFVAPSILIFLISFLESPKAVVTPAGPVRIRVGDPINLECQATGEPRPSVRWHRLDNNRKTMLSSPVPADSSAIMQVMGRLKSSPSWFCFYMSIKVCFILCSDLSCKAGRQWHICVHCTEQPGHNWNSNRGVCWRRASGAHCSPCQRTRAYDSRGRGVNHNTSLRCTW